MKTQTVKALLLGAVIFTTSAISFDSNAGCTSETEITCDGNGCKVSIKIICPF